MMEFNNFNLFNTVSIEVQEISMRQLTVSIPLYLQYLDDHRTPSH